MLLPRILTALVGIPLVLAAIYFGGIFYMAFVIAIILLCLYEYGLILLTAKKPVNRLSLIIFGILMIIGAVAGSADAYFKAPSNLPSFFMALCLAGVFIVEVLTPKRSLERAANTLLGIIFIPWALSHLINIRMIEPYGEYFTYMMFFTIWATDTGAYFAGRFFGRHSLNKEVSPKKTWEGTIGGTITGVGVALLCWNLFFPGYISMGQAAFLGFIISALGQVSDLSQSILKRSAGVKDSSNILPGHGGFFDRFDAFLLTAPVLYYVIVYIIPA